MGQLHPDGRYIVDDVDRRRFEENGFVHLTGLLTEAEVAVIEADYDRFLRYDYVPDAREIDGHLVVCASRRRKPCSFFRTSDPLSGEWRGDPGTFPF